MKAWLIFAGPGNDDPEFVVIGTERDAEEKLQALFGERGAEEGFVVGPFEFSIVVNT